MVNQDQSLLIIHMYRILLVQFIRQVILDNWIRVYSATLDSSYHGLTHDGYDHSDPEDQYSDSDFVCESLDDILIVWIEVFIMG